MRYDSGCGPFVRARVWELVVTRFSLTLVPLTAPPAVPGFSMGSFLGSEA